MSHIMIDLETLGLTTDAVVIQLGYAIFSEAKGIEDSGNFFLDPVSQMRKGRTIDWGTINWWLQQDEQARRTITQAAYTSPEATLLYFLNWVPWSTIEGVWSHGAAFDIPILESLLTLYQHKPRWSYKSVRDTRTLFMLAEGGFEWVKNDLKHNAMEDAKAQALTVLAAMKALKELDNEATIARETL